MQIEKEIKNANTKCRYKIQIQNTDTKNKFQIQIKNTNTQNISFGRNLLALMFS